ncbi:MAG: hypothetical protein P5702_22445 [Limnospira sp. PMC 1291.21]|uniref:RuBisCO accumulation factor 1 n=1 Tax=Limnospira indica PCC 8005 TaxID=376219 RepID=A0A9P1NZM4_9CYAN|nr:MULTISPECIES: RuBisCO accumulation factor 1 [Limnospira]EKD07623.1 hypothetical protein SPLC1_S380340 [Arthrospira platensis C1]MDY7051479.1 RuBisCO accumulation factor 1 [Limnospira fusiformis LS22]QJB25686.1 hypothetical protein HFV01_07605 [Limnospira fusiformis SAG 85.79]MDT9180203.1 hypothetical protein [Limnospira sp. PMC 1238.20]MDT9190428.1 hypothetical protein [Limnospira sp. PMC 894.15]
MTETSPNPKFTPPVVESNVDQQALIKQLRRKEGSWVEWGQACATLQKCGKNSQEIFEDTGFEPVQQNQVIVASQVYHSMVKGEASEKVRSHFWQKGSDILYELRILTQPLRVAAAGLILEYNLDADEARNIARALKDFSLSGGMPEGFSTDAGDMVAYYFAKLARQQKDIQERSRLIAKGLKFVKSTAARSQLEQLLTDFTVSYPKTAPRLPVYRLEESEELPCIVPVAGRFPLNKEDWQAVPLCEAIEPFGIIKFNGGGAWLALPGWQVVRNSEDPVVILCQSDQLPTPLPGQVEEVVAVIDRAGRTWQADSYFLVEIEGQLELQWFEDQPETPLLGRVILILRPKRIVDENQMTDIWQIEE